VDTHRKAQLFSDYIRSLNGFKIVDYFDGNYQHMGATISDAILQAGLNYETVVRPKIKNILEIYPEAVTTSAFWQLLNEKGPKIILGWKDDEKPNRILGLTKLLLGEGIETEEELSIWIVSDANESRLLNLRGIGPKTIDYIKILVGLQTVAVDQHLYTLLDEAGITGNSYEEARDIINLTADIMGTERVLMDHSFGNICQIAKSGNLIGASAKKQVGNSWHRECIQVRYEPIKV
jgi:hypothetical protein